MISPFCAPIISSPCAACSEALRGSGLPIIEKMSCEKPEQYKVEFLPTFIIVNREMFVLSDNGRRDMVENEGVKAYEKWYKAYRTRKEELQKENIEKEEDTKDE